MMIDKLNNIEQELLTLMKGDERTFSNPITNEDYIYDAIFKAYTILKNLHLKLKGK